MVDSGHQNKNKKSHESKYLACSHGEVILLCDVIVCTTLNMDQRKQKM